MQRDLDLVTPFWRADKRVHAIIFKCCNAVEQYNGMLLELFGLGTNDRTGRRRIHGDFAHRLWYTLADLCWNLIIGFNLDRMKKEGLEFGEPLDWKDVWQNSLADYYSVQQRKGRDLEEHLKHKFKLGTYIAKWKAVAPART